MYNKCTKEAKTLSKKCIICGKEIKDSYCFSLDQYSSAIDTGVYLCRECFFKDAGIDSLMNLEHDLEVAHEKLLKAQDNYNKRVDDVTARIEELKKKCI